MEDNNQNNILEKYRNQIDFFDSEIINLLHERFEIVKLVWKYKKENKIKPLDQSRWNLLLQKIANQAEDLWLNPILVLHIWDLIHEESLDLEK